LWASSETSSCDDAIFIKVIAGSTTVWPLAARAQQSDKIWHMGFIARGHEKFYDALFQGLQDPPEQRTTCHRAPQECGACIRRLQRIEASGV
jgi:hypothetical protein